MVRKPTRTRKVRSRVPPGPEPILVRCVMRIPRDEANAVLPHLGVPLDCGGAVLKRTRSHVEVQADIEIGTVGAIVEKGVPVLVTKRIPVAPVPAKEFAKNAASWFAHLRRLK